MANFEIALGLTLKNEGGYSNDPQDAGGKTYAGISYKNFPHWDGWLYVDEAVAQNLLHQGELLDSPDLKVLVSRFYRINFWNPIMGDSIINQEVASNLFDSCVNMGVHAAVVLCQESLEILADGKMTTTVLNVLNTNNPYA